MVPTALTAGVYLCSTVAWLQLPRHLRIRIPAPPNLHGFAIGYANACVMGSTSGVVLDRILGTRVAGSRQLGAVIEMERIPAEHEAGGQRWAGTTGQRLPRVAGRLRGCAGRRPGTGLRMRGPIRAGSAECRRERDEDPDRRHHRHLWMLNVNRIGKPVCGTGTGAWGRMAV